MHVLTDKNNQKTQIFQHLTPELNKILGYSEQYIRRLARKNHFLEAKGFEIWFNCPYTQGRKGRNKQKGNATTGITLPKRH